MRLVTRTTSGPESQTQANKNVSACLCQMVEQSEFNKVNCEPSEQAYCKLIWPASNLKSRSGHVAKHCRLHRTWNRRACQLHNYQEQTIIHPARHNLI